MTASATSRPTTFFSFDADDSVVINVIKLHRFACPDPTDNARQDYTLAVHQLMIVAFAYTLDFFNANDKFAERVLGAYMRQAKNILIGLKTKDEEWKNATSDISAVTMAMLLMAYKNQEVGPFVKSLLESILEE
jgi:hypothetical protein